MAVESINKNNTKSLVSEESKVLGSSEKKDLNEAKDTVSIGGNNAVYDMQIKSLSSEIGELKQLVNTLVAQEFVAKRGGTLLNQAPASNTVAPIVTKKPGSGNPMMNSMMTAGSSSSESPAQSSQEPPKPKTEEEIIKEAMQQQILAQMKIKRDMLAWDTTLMKEKFEYELTLSWQQHQTKISEMVMAAFSKIRDMDEQMWLNLKQKEDQMDSQRIKILGGF